MNREIKFQVLRDRILSGYERLTESGWKYMCPELNSETRENWREGVFPGNGLIRRQFTGLYELESNKEIFEGDIVDDGYHKWVIEFFGVSFGVWKNKPDGEFVIFSLSWKVIGNIFENPELLEDVK